MHRTPVGGLAVATAVVTLVACDIEKKKDPPIAPQARSQAITGNPNAVVEQQPAATAAPRPTAVRKRGKLCVGPTGQGATVSGEGLLVAAAPGSALPPETMPVGRGRWTWINFWAAWCAPCKAEIPLLRSWERRLNAEATKVELVFVSLDDDQRQLEQLLANPGATELRSTYWLREGREREKWLSDVGVSKDPQLPVQLLVGPSGKVRCIIEGAVEPEDWPRIWALINDA
ncbi:MAG: redoxin domain-containing protein [Polyangiaceae bacterium]|nr:redoxin domain-containing protein [Polyangiaceae bacterium]